VKIEFNYEPRKEFMPYHNRHQRWSAIVAHRRCGKTVAAINDIIARASYTKKENARFAYIAPFYKQAKDVAWQYLKDFVGDAAVKTWEADLRVKLFNGAWITLYGADNPDSLRGLYHDGVILDEYGDCRPSLWPEVVLPTLVDRKGWALFIGTPKGKNHFSDICDRAKSEEGWYFDELKVSDTKIIDEEELEEMRSQMTEDQYQQEMECSFDAAVQGTYYAGILNSMEGKGQRGLVEYDPEQKVNVACDLGFTDSSALWFWQYKPDGIALIDYEEHNSQPLQFYFDLLDYKHYDYDTIWLPHDAKAKTLQTGRSTIEQFLLMDYPVRIAPKLSIQHGIDAARMVLPMCHFDEEHTSEGWDCLKLYRRNYDEVKKVFVDRPLHDWTSHGADAFRYLSLVCRNRMKLPEAKKEAIVLKQEPIGYTLKGLFEERDKVLSMNRRRI
jgi:hypothetical protein